MDNHESKLIAAILRGEVEAFEVLIERYQPRIFGNARRYARRTDEVEDIVQEVFIKAYQKLGTFRGEAPFEHWLMRLTTRTCYDFLRRHQKNREHPLAELSEDENDWLERFAASPESAHDEEDAARQLVSKIIESLNAEDRMVITMQEIEEKSVKEIAQLTGWSESKVKVRAFRARNQMRKILARIAKEKFL
ncbi:MAG: RNA polymerase subunit sigma-24 [Verrucomicrobiales bacterium]|nr:RNA polymerase subunit sigma-24 [Verrucomicrobiales bacterium]|tara:strand:+ start:244 stop:819 length:576 start_codon:yes stop_codon:yes gene_type:complete